MAMTRPSDVFNAQVVVDLVDERVFKETTLLNSGYINDARKGASITPQGDKVTVVRSVKVPGNLGVQVNDRNGVPVTPDKVKFESDEYDIVSRILAYDMDKRAMKILQNTTDPNAYMAGEVLNLQREHIQDALIAAGLSTDIAIPDKTGLPTWKGLRRAVTKAWGEKQNKLGAPLLIAHSDVVFDLSNTEEAKKSGIFGVTGVVESGVVYKYAGLNIMQLDSIPRLPNGKYQNLIITPNALSYFQDEGMEYHESRVGHTTNWELDWDFSFAAWLSKNKPTGAVIYEAASTIDADDEDE